MKLTYTIAVITDIHSNYTALKAIFNELSDIDIDEIVIAGDHIGDGPNPNLTLDFIRNLNAHVIRGNREEYLVSYHNKKYPYWDEYLQIRSMVWTYNNVSKTNFDFIKDMPNQLVFEAVGSSIRVVHGSPRSVGELILKHQNELINQALAGVSEDILICGHCHQMWHRKVNNTLIVNAGSCGLPFMKAGSAPYSLLIFENGAWKVEECCAHYDINELLYIFNASSIMDCGAWTKAVIASLKSGNIITLEFLRYAKKYALSCGWEDDGGLIPNDYWIKAEKTFDLF